MAQITKKINRLSRNEIIFGKFVVVRPPYRRYPVLRTGLLESGSAMALGEELPDGVGGVERRRGGGDTELLQDGTGRTAGPLMPRTGHRDQLDGAPVRTSGRLGGHAAGSARGRRSAPVDGTPGGVDRFDRGTVHARIPIDRKGFSGPTVVRDPVVGRAVDL